MSNSLFNMCMCLCVSCLLTLLYSTLYLTPAPVLSDGADSAVVTGL